MTGDNEAPEGDTGKISAAASTAAGKTLPSEKAVVEFLTANPDFLLRHEELLAVLTPPSQFSEGEDESSDGGAESDGGSGNVVDMQNFMLNRLQSDLSHLTDNQDALIATSRSNMTSQGQIHEAVLALLRAESLVHLLHIITADLPTILDLDVVTLCVEDLNMPMAHLAVGGVYGLDAGMVDELIGAGKATILRRKTPFSQRIYGPVAPLVGSDALTRLSVGSEMPNALIAIGSRRKDKFHPGQGTELLKFLTRVIEECLMSWLGLTQDP